MSNFHPLEVVSRYRGSETQLQVGENLNNLTEQDEGELYSAIITINDLNYVDLMLGFCWTTLCVAGPPLNQHWYNIFSLFW